MISKKRNYFFVYIEKKLFEIVLKINRSIERFIFNTILPPMEKFFLNFIKYKKINLDKSSLVFIDFSILYSF